MPILEEHELSEDTGRTHLKDAIDNAFVRKLDGLASLSIADRATIGGVSTPSELLKPAATLRSGRGSEAGAIVVLQGFLCRSRRGWEGERQITGFLLAGDHCVIEEENEANPELICAIGNSEVVRLSAGQLAKLMEVPAIALAFRKAAAIDLATLREWLVNIGRRPAERRLAHLFCEISHRLHQVGHVSRDCFSLPATQTDLADTLGLSYVHVNRTLQSLRQRRLISFKGKMLTIHDPAALKDFADFDSYYLAGDGFRPLRSGGGPAEPKA